VKIVQDGKVWYQGKWAIAEVIDVWIYNFIKFYL
jgi:hypothetical protein